MNDTAANILSGHWSRFGSIRCLNLLSRTDRYQDSSALFGSLGMTVDYMRVKGDKNNRIRDNCLTHLQMITESYEGGEQTSLLFEDDIMLNPRLSVEDIDRGLTAAIEFMNTNIDWDILYLGHHPDLNQWSSKINSSIYKTKSLCTHAYIIHRRFVDKYGGATQFKDVVLSRNQPVDNAFHDLANAYCLYPMIFIQSASRSDLSTSQWEMGWKLDAALWTEMYMVNVGVPLWLLLVGIILLVALLYWIYWR